MPSSEPLTPSTRQRQNDDLVERLAGEMARRWQLGERPVAEDYLALHPDLWDQPEAAVELIYQEICLRQEHGEAAAGTDVLDRFPQWQQPLQALLGWHLLLDGEPTRPAFPEVGEMLGDFRLEAELGQGARGRVFLATQLSLAERPVVLKITARDGREHYSLARLQHTHIVPLYSVQDDFQRGVRALCMPYFGGTTLAHLLAALSNCPPAQRSGSSLLHALQCLAAPGSASVLVGGPACEFLVRASYSQAVCWIGACLADALYYASERGLVHLDLKPSNVLLAADGQPMLLDFHLARAPLQAGEPAPAWLGGTPSYMSPEHHAALDAVRTGKSLHAAVDGRADLYSLALVLIEALGGALPSVAGRPGRELRRRNPEVSVGLADLLAKCLANDARDRYPNAAALAADLRRHLDDLPLRGTANRSALERWRKWRRRRPHALLLAGLVLTGLAAGSIAGAHVVQQLGKARQALQEGIGLVHEQRYGEAAVALKHGLTLTEGLPFNRAVVQGLQEQLRHVERAQAAQELHRFVERLRGLYGADVLNPAEARVIEASCRPFWEQRALIMQRLGSEVGGGLGSQIQADLLDLAILWSELRVALASGANAPAARREALDVLAQAEALFGPSCVLYQVRQSYAAALGLAEEAQRAARMAAALPPRSAWEQFALGRALFQAGELSAAAAAFDHAVAQQPQALWPHVYRAKCAYRRGQYHDAVIAFTACFVLAPERAWCYSNRGLAYTELAEYDRALADYDKALQLDPQLATAALNRGMVHYRARRFGPALDDLQRAQENGVDPALVAYDRALVHVARGDRAAALVCLSDALQHRTDFTEARLLRDRLRQ
jgi:serine/threonine protein kinase/Tfp pilus assembly protein PilF